MLAGNLCASETHTNPPPFVLASGRKSGSIKFTQNTGTRQREHRFPEHSTVSDFRLHERLNQSRCRRRCCRRRLLRSTCLPASETPANLHRCDPVFFCRVVCVQPLLQQLGLVGLTERLITRVLLVFIRGFFYVCVCTVE